MAVRKKTVNYLSNENLLREIALSKERFRSANEPITKAEALTPTLVNMLQLLVENVSQKYNWRSYCVDQSTEALTQRGWLNIDQITEEDMILSYDGGKLKWSKIKSIYRGEYVGNMFKMTAPGIDALVTSEHKWITRNGLKSVNLLEDTDELILMGEPLDDNEFWSSSTALVEPTTICVKNIDFHGGKREEQHGVDKLLAQNEPTIPYVGRVWCPETEFGSFMARRNGTIYLTGNSYLSDMKGDARFALCQNALKFDETKTQNPFSYYTQIVWSCFLSYLDKEKKVSRIRDALLEEQAMMPSFARQAENEEEQRDRPNIAAKPTAEQEAEELTVRAQLDQINEAITLLGKDAPEDHLVRMIAIFGMFSTKHQHHALLGSTEITATIYSDPVMAQCLLPPGTRYIINTEPPPEYGVEFLIEATTLEGTKITKGVTGKALTRGGNTIAEKTLLIALALRKDEIIKANRHLGDASRWSAKHGNGPANRGGRFGKGPPKAAVVVVPLVVSVEQTY